MSFQLHERLAADTVIVGELPLSLLLLSKDANYPWCILVPKREKLEEIYQLSEADQQLLLRESSWLTQTLQTVFTADKINIATLGNVVPQLHMHHVARYKNDVAWPGPVWGAVPAKPYPDELFQQRLTVLRAALHTHIGD